MKKIGKIVWLEVSIVIVTLLIDIDPLDLVPNSSYFIKILWESWNIFLGFFLFIFGAIYTAKKEDPRLFFINIGLCLIYLVSPFIIYYLFYRPSY